MIAFLLLAHGADPTPLDWDEALANLVKFVVTFLLIGFLSYPILSPIFTNSDTHSDDESPEANHADKGSVGWLAVGMALVLAMGWWLTRTSIVEINTEESKTKEDHAHTQEEGGQVAMWGDFHAEFVRVESGEVRIFLRDSYNRDISARFFDAEVELVSPDEQPTDSSKPVQAVPKSQVEEEQGKVKVYKTESALNEAYRFARLPRDAQGYRVRVSTPGWTAGLKFIFDGSKGKRSLPIWCAAPGR